MTQKSRQDSIESLLRTMESLRSPDGCPWDAEQTPESLIPYILEEACELIDAIERGDHNLILDELGDLLLQVVFQAQIFTEKNSFDFYDVAHNINEKLLRRHPHVNLFRRIDTSSTDNGKRSRELNRLKTKAALRITSPDTFRPCKKLRS